MKDKFIADLTSLLQDHDPLSTVEVSRLKSGDWAIDVKHKTQIIRVALSSRDFRTRSPESLLEAFLAHMG